MRSRTNVLTVMAFAVMFAGSMAEARQYHPRQGRFLQRDPLIVSHQAGAGYHDGIDVYEYAQATPGMSTDPHGLMSERDCSCSVRRLLNDDVLVGTTYRAAQRKRFLLLPCIGKIKCIKDCPISGATLGGAYIVNTRDIVLCSANLSGESDVRQFLIHELSHAETICGNVLKSLFMSCDECIEDELSAYRLSHPELSEQDKMVRAIESCTASGHCP